MIGDLSSTVNGINTYNEKSLHAALKQWYAVPADRLETRVDGYIIDLVRGDLLVEIQTGSFSPLKRKLAALVETHPVRLVFPIPLEKWILTQPDEGAGPARRRKSPKRGQAEHVFAELVYIPGLILHHNFSLEVLMIREEEVRRPVRKKHARSKGWVTTERRLLEVVDRRLFLSASDLAALLPLGLAEPFTVRELARAMCQPVWLAQKAIYSLRRMGALEAAGRKGRATLYSKLALTAS
jgi:hypothetical protein